jgi:chemotaxis protein methyltransferase CheR
MFHPSDHDVELSEEEFRLLRDFIHEKFGLFFDEGQRNTLRSRLASRLSSLDLMSFEDYYHYLRFGPQRNEELTRMASHLTNNETYFFREQPQLQVFQDHVLRSIKERKAKTNERKLRVLSAGCSTGEEIHSLAMLIYDSGQFFWNWEVELFALDVDEAALEKARRGLYFHNSFRGLAPAIRERHFFKEGPGERVKEPLRRMIQFRRGNLMDAQSFESYYPLDAIFCRNVLIYFSDTAIRRVVEHFWSALVPEGYLLLGHAESLSRITDMFTPIRFPGAMIYQKPAGRTP